jgi:hypothetical protein
MSDISTGRVARFGSSAVLRFGSAAVQLWGGIVSGQSALIIEAGEEFSDALTFGAVAVEAKTERKIYVRRARRAAMFFALGAALIASAATAIEILHEAGEWLEPMGGFSFGDRGVLAASIALALSAGVFIINFSSRKSGLVSDKFAYRDSLRDFVIPGSILILAAGQAPHILEFTLEAGGLVYGWYNVAQLMKGWNLLPARVWRVVSRPATR